VIEIRSYRRVFDLERRIYRIDRLRLNPSGVPVRGVVYFLAALLCSAVLARLPLLGDLAALVPWYVRDLALPAAGAALLGVIRVEGRPFHLAAMALLSYGCAPHRLAGLRGWSASDERWRPETVVLLPDGSDGGMRRLRYSGPGALLIGLEHERRERVGLRGGRAAPGVGVDLVVSELRDGGRLGRRQAISLERGARVLIRPAATRGGRA
jgi:hypothetical protein